MHIKKVAQSKCTSVNEAIRIGIDPVITGVWLR